VGLFYVKKMPQASWGSCSVRRTKFMAEYLDMIELTDSYLLGERKILGEIYMNHYYNKNI
jgi:hypothetical protein